MVSVEKVCAWGFKIRIQARESIGIEEECVINVDMRGET